VIPANDDSIRAVDLLLNELADAVAIGKSMAGSRPEPTQRQRRTRSKRPVLARARENENKAVATVEEKQEQPVDSAAQEDQTEQQESV
jgi:ribosomal protein S2